METVALCPACAETLPADAFHKNRSTKNGLARLCKACINAYHRSWESGLTAEQRRERQAKRPTGRRTRTPANPGSERHSQMFHKYKITPDEYAAMLRAQGGVCMICEAPETVRGKSGELRQLCVDHDHSCCPGKVTCGKCIRGLLCARCNKALGLFSDDPRVMLTAVAYLERSAQMVAA